MASVARLEKLFSALAARDWARARSMASLIADDEESRNHVPAAQNHVTAAQRLRAALTPVGGTATIMPAASGASFRSENALTSVSAASGLNDLVLGVSNRQQLLQVVAEWQSRERLQSAAVRRRSRILFHGPPGCGKSISAAALGYETGLPVHVVRLDAIVGSFLGETATRVHALLRWASENPTVVVLDEIDAIAHRRGRSTEVAELDRVVIALLQELEHTSPAGLLVATTNRIGVIDEALFRRFDLVLKFPRPARASIERFLRDDANRLDLSLTSSLLREARSARSFADAHRILEDARRRQLLASPMGRK
jgi:AAA+ superfamily predicted ATPase